MQAGYREFIAIRERMICRCCSPARWSWPGTSSSWRRCPRSCSRRMTTACPDVAQIDAAELYRREPQLAPGALAAVEVPGESVIDPEHAADLPGRRASNTAATIASIPR
ncbi:hypothetical protein M8494_10145 [Serratia ureilytica]